MPQSDHNANDGLDPLVAYLAKKATEPAAEHPHPGPMETIREATYKGHRIVVRTTYVIEVDGAPLGGHVEVANNGIVHHHALPNYGFPSTIDLIKELIDRFPDEFGAGGHEHGGAARGGHTGEHSQRKER